jgi:hypothetical protein
MDFVMDLQLFGGGGESTTTSREIPDQTANELGLENFLLNSASIGGNMAPYTYQAFAGSLNDAFLPNLNDYMSEYIRRSDYDRDWYSDYMSKLYEDYYPEAVESYNKNMKDALSKYDSASGGALSAYNAAQGKRSSLWDDLVNGVLPSQYAANRQAALNADLKGTMGSAINNLASRGVINSGVGNKAMDDISQSASDTLAKRYADDLQLQASLLGQDRANTRENYDVAMNTANNDYSNRTNNYGSVMQNYAKYINDASGAASTWFNNVTNKDNDVMNNAISSQAASLNVPSQMLSYASQLSQPTSNLYNTMYSGRMGTGSTTTSHDDGGAGMWSAVGGLGAAAIMCFHGNTLVTTPKGYKAIRNVQVGDEVLSVHEGEIVPKKVTAVIGPTRQAIIDVYFENGTVWHTTKGQRYFDGTHFGYVEHEGEPALVYNGNKTHILEVRESGKTAMVYDLTLEGFAGENVFFANDVAAEGFGD